MFLNLLIEIILLTILIGVPYYGYKKGIVGLTLKPLKLLLSIAISLLFCRSVGSRFIAPMIINGIRNGFAELATAVIYKISVAIAFCLLLFITRIIISLILSLAEGFFKEGIIGRINSSLGLVLSAVIGLLSAYLFTLMCQRFFSLAIFEESTLVKNFSGGLLYRLLIRLGAINFSPRP